jgi:probable rRNA maturation factor
VIAIANRQHRSVDVGRLRRTARLALRALGVPDYELSLTLVDDREIRALNARYRGARRATDVLAFPLAGPARILGEAIISVETARRQARALGHSLGEELDLLCCHGCLHLVGYDDRDPLEARLMHAREMSLLGRVYARPAPSLHVLDRRGPRRPLRGLPRARKERRPGDRRPERRDQMDNVAATPPLGAERQLVVGRA